MMDRRTFAVAALVALLAPSHLALAQSRPPLIAYVSGGTPDDFRVQSFRQGLQETGWIVGENVLVRHFFFTSGEQLPEIARNIDALKPDAIMSLGTHTTGAMLAGTHNIPIVFAAVTDPIASGYANSLARPGGMATGVSLMASEIAGKRVQFLQELIPDITRIAVFTNPDNSSGLITSAQIEAAGGILGVQVRVVEAQGADADLDAVVEDLAADGVKALVFVADFTYTRNESPIWRRNINWL